MSFDLLRSREGFGMTVLRVTPLIAAVAMVAVFLPGVARADHVFPDISGSACVTSTEFRFDIDVNHLGVNATGNTFIRGLAVNESFQVSLRLTGADTVVVSQDLGVSGNGARWAVGTFPFVVSATRVATDDFYSYYDVDFSGVIPNGSSPFVPGNTWGTARALDAAFGFVVISPDPLPITDCEGEPPESTTTTTEPETTTTEPETTTTEPETTTTIADEVSPTSIVGTTTTIVSVTTSIVSTTAEVSPETLPFTGFENGTSGLLALVVVATGALALVGTRMFRRETDE